MNDEIKTLAAKPDCLRAALAALLLSSFILYTSSFAQTPELHGASTAPSLTLTPSAAPGSPVEGQLYYDSTAHALKYRNASAWVGVSGGGGSSISQFGVVYVDPVNGNDGTGALGDPGHSYATLQAAWNAWNTAHGGANSLTMVIMPGTYSGGLLIRSDSSTHDLTFVWGGGIDTPPNLGAITIGDGGSNNPFVGIHGAGDSVSFTVTSYTSAGLLVEDAILNGLTQTTSVAISSQSVTLRRCRVLSSGVQSTGVAGAAGAFGTAGVAGGTGADGGDAMPIYAIYCDISGAISESSGAGGPGGNGYSSSDGSNSSSLGGTGGNAGDCWGGQLWFCNVTGGASMAAGDGGSGGLGGSGDAGDSSNNAQNGGNGGNGGTGATFVAISSIFGGNVSEAAGTGGAAGGPGTNPDSSQASPGSAGGAGTGGTVILFNCTYTSGTTSGDVVNRWGTYDDGTFYTAGN